ncbi:MAG: CNNM domain-containing protein, partial [Muribaculaceae bacterium]|nr:CNNM domain-containing protein [Muribaculaceae bacterium]
MDWAQIVALLVAALALIISAFVSGSEIAYFSITQQQLDDMDDTPRNNGVRSLLEIPERLLATILIANNLVNVTIVILCTFALGPIFTSLSPVLSFILQTVLLTFLILLFGEILPKLCANSNPMRWARMAVPGLKAAISILYPVASMLVRSSSMVQRVVAKRPDNISADELSQALELTDVKGREDSRMLHEILKFGDTTASEIMTPRVDLTAIALSSPFQYVMHEVVESGYARIPVYENT